MTPPAARPTSPWRHLAVLLVPAACLCCATWPRQTSTTSVTVSGGVAQAIDRRYGCNGEFLDGQTHEQVGGHVAVVHQHASGLRAGAAVGHLRGRLVDTEGFPLGVENLDWSFSGGGAMVGYEGRLFRGRVLFQGEVGASTWLITDQIPPDAVFPYASFRSGLTDRFWLGGRLGSWQSPLDPNVLSTEGGWLGDGHRGTVGVMLLMNRPSQRYDVAALPGGGQTLLRRHTQAKARHDGDQGLFFELEGDVDPRLGLHLHGVIAENWSLQLGFTLRFETAGKADRRVPVPLPADATAALD